MALVIRALLFDPLARSVETLCQLIARRAARSQAADFVELFIQSEHLLEERRRDLARGLRRRRRESFEPE